VQEGSSLQSQACWPSLPSRLLTSTSACSSAPRRCSSAEERWCRYCSRAYCSTLHCSLGPFSLPPSSPRNCRRGRSCRRQVARLISWPNSPDLGQARPTGAPPPPPAAPNLAPRQHVLVEHGQPAPVTHLLCRAALTAPSLPVAPALQPPQLGKDQAHQVRGLPGGRGAVQLHPQHSVWASIGSLYLGLYLYYFVIPKHICADGRKHR
jgi:hypothetical protein